MTRYPDQVAPAIQGSLPAPDSAKSVDVTEHIWIPMPDGIRLAARRWLPRTAWRTPVPAILEYIPYRKADMVRARDDRNHPFFAEHGYACLRVDMRGSGDSEGLLADMYTDPELSDVRHVIAWIASQPWCSGRVGMFGTSWGGTAALQASVDAPRALKAVIAVCATHDRYEDDIHYMGGCLLGDSIEWGATLPAILGAPPTPCASTDWCDLWRTRLNGLEFPLETWIREQARGDYWRHGSVIHQVDRLSVPILAVGGWADRYSNSVMSLVSARPDLVWGVVGAWGHHFPDQGSPGPAIGFQQLALEWWDHWLKEPVGMADWPRLRVWLRDFEPPADSIDQRKGRWIQTGPPAQHTVMVTWHVGEGGLAPEPPKDRDWCVPCDLAVGRDAGDTGYFGRFGGLPLDQREEDARSLVFETRPLEEAHIVYGGAEMHLVLETDFPLGQLAVRLNDVAPDGTSVRVALAVRNLALDDCLDSPGESIGGGGFRTVRMPFPTVAYRLRKGHRIRISFSASYWPMVWPSPGRCGPRLLAATLGLPIFRGVPDALSRSFPAPLDLPRIKTHDIVRAPRLTRFSRSDADGTLRCGWRQPYTEIRFHDTETTYGFETAAEYVIHPGDPLSARYTFRHCAEYHRPDGTAVLDSAVSVCGTADHFLLRGHLAAKWDGMKIAERSWNLDVPRCWG